PGYVRMVEALALNLEMMRILCLCLIGSAAALTSCGTSTRAGRGARQAHRRYQSADIADMSSTTWEWSQITPRRYGRVIQKVHFVNTDSGWAAGWDGVIMHTTDGCRMWTKQDSGTDLVLRDIRFTNETDGWINAMDDATGQHVLLRTTDAGVMWRRTE